MIGNFKKEMLGLNLEMNKEILEVIHCMIRIFNHPVLLNVRKYFVMGINIIIILKFILLLKQFLHFDLIFTYINIMIKINKLFLLIIYFIKLIFQN